LTISAQPTENISFKNTYPPSDNLLVICAQWPAENKHKLT